MTTETTLSRRDEFALRIACCLIGASSTFLPKDKKEMSLRDYCLYGISAADTMIDRLDEVENE